ncbi:MAG: alpha/beta hydrolase [Syntrophales bacterium]|jgi:pimeloyl-ACP methyl ester carboxylesterase
MADTIFMIHGMWAGGWYWENYVKYFGDKGYRCVSTTLRYHEMDPNSLPDSRLGTTSILDYANDLKGEIRKLGDKPIIMGHSMGGLLTQILASRGLAKTAVMIAPASPRGILALKPSVIKSFFSVMIKPGFWKKPMRLSFDAFVYSQMHLLSPEMQCAKYSQVVYESGRAASEIGFWLLDPNQATNVDESKVTCPVLIIAGSQDRITPASVVKNVAKKYKAVSTFKEYPDHAHSIILETGWQKVAEDIEIWLKKQTKTS